MQFLNDVTIGQYFSGTSVVHRLDPRAKLLFVMIAMVSFFSWSHWVELIFWSLAAVGILKLSGIPARLLLRNLRPFLWILVLTFLLQWLFSPVKDGPRLVLGPIKLPMAALSQSAFYCVRIILVIFYSAILTLSTSPLELADALERLLKPARKLKFPVHEMAIMTSIAVRFIPTIIEEAQRLRKAQMARGAKFEGSLVQRVRSLVPMILPLFFSTLKRAEELAIAMEARCYDSRARRTSFNKLAWKKRETLVITGTLVLVMVFKLSAF